MEFGSVGFWGEGKTGEPGEKPLGARERTNNKLNRHMVSTAGFEPWQCGRRALSPLRHPCSLEQSNSVPTFLGQMQTGCRWLGTKYTYQRNETVFPTDFVFEKFPEENQSKIVYFYSVIYEFHPTGKMFTERYLDTNEQILNLLTMLSDCNAHTTWVQCEPPYSFITTKGELVMWQEVTEFNETPENQHQAFEDST